MVGWEKLVRGAGFEPTTTCPPDRCVEFSPVKRRSFGTGHSFATSLSSRWKQREGVARVEWKAKTQQY